MRIFISAGEASGDMHAAALTREILAMRPDAEVFGMGGDALRAAGGEVIFDYKDHSVMGFVEVLRKLPDLFALRDAFRRVMVDWKPDIFVTVDYPDFNMRVAKIAKSLGIPVFSYIPPSAWAWRRGRAKMVAQLAAKVACIYPFAYEVYKEAGAPVEFVGNPLVDIVKPTLSREEAEKLVGKKAGHPLILLLPGSRAKELEGVLPVMLEALPLILEKEPEAEFVLEQAPSVDPQQLSAILSQTDIPIRVIKGHGYDVMSVCDAALATSGTVILECALCGLPSVICYKASPISIAIAKALVKVKYIGLPNLLAGKEILPELIQEKMTPQNMASWILRFLEPDYSKKVHQDIREAVARLGEPGAVRRTSALIIKTAEENK
ncbi:MAG: lipid-A-disaccharide synthase [Acidaminococcus sp.]|jgi:lipid-A-disaccharide synthase|nr:lipid-A-disaccharide synthase [Acidaminococcus sp.]MCI2099872.1 lipid-A-disaccharide synthase [Acidaminococcus sp.]MCI2114103.1 lipid-A-disaccharide synthase [Acidaminococcus sp.]MCI2116043.1 lipid-A-disaccharide synthase [Acidaminococcus sp.]